MTRKQKLFTILGVVFVALALCVPAHPAYIKYKMTAALGVRFDDIRLDSNGNIFRLRFTVDRRNTRIRAARINISIRNTYGDVFKTASIPLESTEFLYGSQHEFCLPYEPSSDGDKQLHDLLKTNRSPYPLHEYSSAHVDWAPDVFVLDHGKRWVLPHEPRSKSQ